MLLPYIIGSLVRNDCAKLIISFSLPIIKPATRLAGFPLVDPALEILSVYVLHLRKGSIYIYLKTCIKDTYPRISRAGLIFCGFALCFEIE